MKRDTLLERLRRLDEDADLMFEDSERMVLVIVGGGALILQQFTDRATHDIDAIKASPQLLGLMERHDINARVQTYINNFPFNYEDRLVPLELGGKKIDFYTASLEDIVIAKLYSSRDQDKKDIVMKDVLSHMDWERLEHLALDEGEARASALNDRNYSDFFHNYEEYARRYRP